MNRYTLFAVCIQWLRGRCVSDTPAKPPAIHLKFTIERERPYTYKFSPFPHTWSTFKLIKRHLLRSISYWPYFLGVKNRGYRTENDKRQKIKVCSWVVFRSSNAYKQSIPVQQYPQANTNIQRSLWEQQVSDILNIRAIEEQPYSKVSLY